VFPRLMRLVPRHILFRYDNAGIVQAQYFRGSVIDEVVNGYLKDNTNKPVNVTFHHDILQSMLGLSGHEGSVLNTQTYSPFGSGLSQTGTSTNALQYTGREVDGETGFYYYRARYYDPITGRFVSEDPIGFDSGDVNFYAYVGNNPVNANDPSGEILNVFLGAGTSVALGYGISLITNQPYTSTDLLRDAGLGAVGAGILGKINTLNKLNEINQLTSAGRNLVTSGAAPKFTSTISQNLTKTEANKLGQSFVSQGEQFSFRAPALKVKTGNVQANFGSSVLKSSGNPKVITNIHANVTPLGTNVKEGFVGGIFGGTTSYAAANGGFVLYPNKSNTNQMTSVYAK
jgi:RHS repeat-associated protein